MSDHGDIVRQIEAWVRDEMEGVCAAHDMYHINRVRHAAMAIYAHEIDGWGTSCDPVVVEAGALLHESLDDKFFASSDMATREREICDRLEALWLTAVQVDAVRYVIQNVGYGKSLERGDDFVMTCALAIVEDADRLDAIGAIAIARTFAYGGRKWRMIYDPSVVTRNTMTRAEYAEPNQSDIHHFYEKLLLLKDLMHTSYGRQVASERHAFMEEYVAQFFRERNGDDITI